MLGHLYVNDSASWSSAALRKSTTDSTKLKWLSSRLVIMSTVEQNNAEDFAYPKARQPAKIIHERFSVMVSYLHF